MEDLHQVIADLLAEPGASARRVRLRVTSGSMRPVIQPGDVLACQSLAEADLHALRLGDILIIRREEDFLAHRLIRRSGEAWYTKGDRLRSLDAPANAGQILARVTAVERGGRVVDLTRWDQRIFQWLKGLWAAATVVLFKFARFLFRR